MAPRQRGAPARAARRVRDAAGAAAMAGLIGWTACSARVQRFELVFDPCAPLVLEAEEGAGEDEVAVIEGAIELWNEVADIEATTSGAQGARSLPVHFEDEVWYYGRFDDARGRLEVATWIEDADTMAIVLAHEIGHAYNLYHVDPDERASVMNAGNLDTPPTEGDGEELTGLWGECADRGAGS